MEKTSLAEAVKSRRERRKMTHQGLADAAGVTRQTVIAVESGRIFPRVDTFASLARGLEVLPSTLMADCEAT